MRNKSRLFVILSILPLTALADQEEVFIPIFITIISVIVFIAFMLFAKLEAVSKAVLIFVSFAAMTLTYFLTENLPFRENMKLINYSVGIIPPLFTLVSYLYIKIYKGRMINK